MDWQVETQSEEATKALGRQLAQHLKGGEVVCLIGELGSGKTTFVQGLAEGLGIPIVPLSPTFTLVREYNGRLPLFHVDAYRLNGLSPEAIQQQIGLWDYMERGGVVVIEWADVIAPALPAERLDIVFEHTLTGRRLRFLPHGNRYTALVLALRQRS